MKFILSTLTIASLLLAYVEARSKFISGESWNYILGDESFDLSKEKATVIDIDYTKSADVIKKYHNAGKKVICYFSGGTIEEWRDDFKDFKAVSGLVKNTYGDWPDEYWLDIRVSGLRPLLKKRMKIAYDKKCDGIEVDNLDGYSVNKGHWDVKESDAIEFAKWLANTAHEVGISIGLKNVPDLIGKLESYYDFAINESCVNHNECHLYKPFLNNNKAVFGITYGNFDTKLASICKNLDGLNISMIVKESLIIKQAGYTFDGKKHCGSSFNTGASSSSSNKAAVTAKKTTVKKTTTVVSKPTTVVTNTNVNAANTAAKAPVNNAVSNTAINNVAASNNAAVSNNEVASKTKEEIIVDNDMFTITETTVIEGAEPVNNAVDPSDIPIETSDPNISTTPVEEDNSKEISDQFDKEEGSNTGTIVGVAVTGSVVGAAALAVLIKKNPKQYEQIKRSISRRATSVRRGASTISRRLTNKKPKSITLPRSNGYAGIENANAIVESNNKNEYNFNNYDYEPNDNNFNDNAYNMNSYRYKFTQNLDDFIN